MSKVIIDLPCKWKYQGDFTELEYKYKANDISLVDFRNLMNTLEPHDELDVSSWDSYYTKGENEFVRFRNSPSTPELTVKRKTNSNNNWNRVEVDLPLDFSRIKDSQVDKFLNILDYSKNFKIYKSCFIYWVGKVNFVYYIVYDEDMVELDRFIEVEVNKKAVDKDSVSMLNEYEKKLSVLGISAQNRTKKSLFEFYKKDVY